MDTETLYNLVNLLVDAEVPCAECPVSKRFCHKVRGSRTACIQNKINWLISSNKKLMNTIKPCYNCGSSNVYVRTILHPNKKWGVFNIQCMDCGKKLRENNQYLSDAIQAWNARYLVLGDL